MLMRNGQRALASAGLGLVKQGRRRHTNLTFDKLTKARTDVSAEEHWVDLYAVAYYGDGRVVVLALPWACTRRQL